MKLKEHYKKKVVPELTQRFKYKNIFEVPKLKKIVVNVGISSQAKDTKVQEMVSDTLKRITGQTPVKTKARKSISGFKIRAGMVVGVKVTLRGNRMYDFVEKLIKVVLPRIRDFRGISFSSLDQSGNLTLGFRESTAFPELQSDTLEHTHGLEITVTTTANNKEASAELLKLLGFPFGERR